MSIHSIITGFRRRADAVPVQAEVDDVGNLYVTSSGLTVNIDYVSGTNPIYIGTAAPGTATSAAAWLIKKLSFDGSNNFTGMAYAGGSSSFNQVWDDRASLSYS